MAMVGFSEAAKLARVSRQHLYKMADAGQISVIKELLPGKSGDSPKNYRQVIDVSELQRVFGQLSTVDSVGRQLITPDDSESNSDHRVLETELHTAKQLLRERDEQLRKAEEREEWLKKQVDETQNIFKLIGHSSPALDAEKMVPVEKLNRIVEAGQAKIDRLLQELERERNKGFFARLFNSKPSSYKRKK